MDCKFKQIKPFNTHQDYNFRQSQSIAKNSLNSLLGRFANQMYQKKAFEKSRVFMNNNLLKIKINSVKQVFQMQPKNPVCFQEQNAPKKETIQNHRPLSANIKLKVNIRHKRNSSRSSLTSRRNAVTALSFQNRALRPRTSREFQNTNDNLRGSNKRKKDQQIYYPLQWKHQQQIEQNSQLIEELRQQKQQQQNKRTRKNNFLKSIIIDADQFRNNQKKFTQTYASKSFIYGSKGQIIQINKDKQTHLKKISALAKSKIQINQKQTQVQTDTDQSDKQNIYIPFKGRGSNKTNTNKIQVQPEKDLKSNQITNNVKQNQIQRAGNTNKTIQKQKINDKIKQTQNDQTCVQAKAYKRVKKNLFYQSENCQYNIVDDDTSY